MEQSPRTGDLSADGKFRWDGSEWAPLAAQPRTPTSWTRPLRLASAAVLAIGAVQVLVTNALFETVANIQRALEVQSPGLTPDQAHTAAMLGFEAGWITAVVEAVLLLVLAAGSVRGWGLVFWLDLAAFALSSIGVITNPLALTNAAAQTQPAASIVIGLLLSLAALVMLIWFVVAAVRYGPWAMRAGTAR